MKLKLNSEFAKRHLFVTLLMAGMGCWFGYDGFVRYPATPAAELYKSIEGADAPKGFDLDGFKRQKTQTQYGFTALSLLAALVIGLHLLGVSKFRFTWDENGFSVHGKHYAYDDIISVDRTKWAKKGILALNLKDGTKAKLDAWHHTGVKEFESSRLQPKS